MNRPVSSSVKPLPPEDLDHVLAHTRELWGEARGQAFFITGRTGFFGMWLLESFTHANDTLGLGARAVVFTRDPIAFVRAGCSITPLKPAQRNSCSPVRVRYMGPRRQAGDLWARTNRPVPYRSSHAGPTPKPSARRS